ncbi:hypothetical protein LCGC14_1078380 [marine sediment metagenome]|uniref:MYM-type domain-containing protein n=1 Tax=marine sediment metagenome TaxID=412755 RepID=A0A0F9N3M9_9ZZZZ
MSGTRTRIESVEWCEYCAELIPDEPHWFVLPIQGHPTQPIAFCSKQCLNRWARNKYYLCPECDEEVNYEAFTSFETLCGLRYFCSITCGKAWDAELRLDG